MAVIPHEELRNNMRQVLRRAEAGERLTIAIRGRPVAELGPVRPRLWVDSAELRDLWDLPGDLTLERDLDTSR